MLNRHNRLLVTFHVVSDALLAVTAFIIAYALRFHSGIIPLLIPITKGVPPLRQYIIASDTAEKPYDRTQRSWVYQSAKGVNNVIGFGSVADHNAPGKMHILPIILHPKTQQIRYRIHFLTRACVQTITRR